MKLALWEERSLLSANTTKQSKKRMNTCHRVSSNFKCIYEVEWEHCLAPVNAFHLAQKGGGGRCHLTQRNFDVYLITVMLHQWRTWKSLKGSLYYKDANWVKWHICDSDGGRACNTEFPDTVTTYQLLYREPVHIHCYDIQSDSKFHNNT